MAEEYTELSLEEAFDRLEQILERLEDHNLPLEESFRLYQNGMQLLAHCNGKIDTVEKKILIMNGDGGLDEFQ
jgi:exodeoxyribonuclease VII small subunit